MTIYNPQGEVIYDAPITKDAIIRNTLMEDYYIEIPFEVVDILPFAKGCYILYKDRKFEIMENVFAEPLTNKAGYKYTLRFEAQQSHLKRCKVFWGAAPRREVTFHNTTDLSSFGQLIINNVNYFLGGSTWELGGIPADLEKPTKLISFNGDSCWDALTMIAETFEVEWWTVETAGKVFLYFGKLEYGTEEEFKAGDVVSSIPVRSGDDSEYGTRFYVFGSTRNLPDDYMSNIVQGGVANHISEVRLHLPNNIGYIDAWDNLQRQDIVEQVVFFDDIFPKNTETVTAISTVDREIIEGQTDKAWVMTCADTPFTPDDMIEGDEFGCTFTSGSLMGRSFELSINTESFDKKFELIAQTEGDGDNMIIIPNSRLHPEVGDTFILTGVNLPKARITEAENELLDKGTSWAVKKSRDTNIYDCPTNAVYCHKNDKNYDLGQKVRLVGEQFGKNGRASRIQGYEKKLYDEYQATYTVGDNTAYSRFGTIEKNIEQAAYAERIGVVSGVGVYVIRSKYDTTQPSDNSVYSSLATELLFLSKLKGGTVLGDTTFKKRVTANEVVTDNLHTQDFQDAGMGGVGFGVTKDANGNSVVTTDILKVRMRAEFQEAVINQTTFEQGETIFSLAGCAITKVEENGNVYRCYYDNRDGNKYSGFKAGDQARCQRYDATYDGVIKYYWRVVAAAGEDYVDLYKSGEDANGNPLVDGDGIPAVGDNLVHFGNRDDKTRQSVIVIAGKPEPTILQYRGVDSFSLVGTLVTKISPNDNKFTGKVVIEAGSEGAENLGTFGKNNLLRNSGFNGDYLSKQLEKDSTLGGDSEMFSPSLVHWETKNVVVRESEVSESGAEVKFNNGSMSQELINNIVEGDTYVLSFRGKGSAVAIAFAGNNEVIDLTDEYAYYSKTMVASDSTNKAIKFASFDGILCEIQLERGTIPSTWGDSMWDNTSALARYQELEYLRSAMKDGKTEINGGLILSRMLALFEDAELQRMTAGVNGSYVSPDTPAFWAGGSLDAAIDTVQRFRSNPSSITDEEWSSLAKFVATHGGDVFMRGYIHALGGLFQGAVDIAGGKIKLNADGSGSVANRAFYWDENGKTYRNFPDDINWQYAYFLATNGTIDFSTCGYIQAGEKSDWNQSFTLNHPAHSFTYWLRGFKKNYAGTTDFVTIFKDKLYDSRYCFKYESDNATIEGHSIKFNRTALFSKGHIIIRWGGGEGWVEVDGSLTVGGQYDNDCDVQIINQ